MYLSYTRSLRKDQNPDCFSFRFSLVCDLYFLSSLGTRNRGTAICEHLFLQRDPFNFARFPLYNIPLLQPLAVLTT